MKNIIIKINETKTISVKNYLLNLLSLKKFNKNYDEKKEEINSFLRTKAKEENLNSMEITKFITEILADFEDELSSLRRKKMIDKYERWLAYFENWNLSDFDEVAINEVENLIKGLEKMNEIEKVKMMKMYLRMAER